MQSLHNSTAPHIHSLPRPARPLTQPDPIRDLADKPHRIRVIVSLLVVFRAGTPGCPAPVRVGLSRSPVLESRAVAEVSSLGAGLFDRHPTVAAVGGFPVLDTAHGDENVEDRGGAGWWCLRLVEMSA